MSFRIEHRIGVAAPASEVWELVYDLGRWPEWTGLYSHASGKIAIGETLHFTYTLAERAPVSVNAKVFDWVPDAQLAWTADVGFRLRSLRYVEIERLTETSCILANGEYYSGWGAIFMSRSLKSASRAAFQRMNERAKGVVETAWAAKGGQARIEPDPAPAGVFTIQPLIKPTRARPARMWGMGGGVGGFGPRLMK